MTVLLRIWTWLRSIPATVWIALALIGVGVYLGNLYGSREWKGKYDDLRVEVAEQRTQDVKDKLAEKERLDAEWLKVQELQATYTELNKEAYDDIRAKLDAVAASVAGFGKRVARLCVVPSPAHAGGLPVIAPTAAVGGSGTLSDGREPAVAGDSGSGGGTPGYDVYPEVTALMKRSDEIAVKCNGALDYYGKALGAGHAAP